MADKDKKRKYLLFAKDDTRPSSQKPCAFFISSEGCRNGSKCPFLHEKNSSGNTSSNVNATTSSLNQSASKEKSSKAKKTVQVKSDSSDSSSSDSDSDSDSSSSSSSSSSRKILSHYISNDDISSITSSITNINCYY